MEFIRNQLSHESSCSISIAGVTLPTFVVGIDSDFYLLCQSCLASVIWPRRDGGPWILDDRAIDRFRLESSRPSSNHLGAFPGYVRYPHDTDAANGSRAKRAYSLCKSTRAASSRRIWYIYALKNTLLPVVTILGLQLGNIIAFSVVTENVFAWPGLGSLFLQSIQTADMPVISIYLILVGAIFMFINLAVELCYPLIDARVLRRHS